MHPANGGLAPSASVLSVSQRRARRRGRWLAGRAGVVALTMVTSLLSIVPLADRAAAAPAKPAKPACPATRPDEASALMMARLCGGKVEVSGDLSETTEVWANPN